MLQFRDETRAREELEKNLKGGEVILSIGKAVRNIFGTKYYTGLTNERMIIANCVEGALFRYKNIPLAGLNSYLKNRGIVLLPFDSPFLIRKLQLAKFKRLQEMVAECLVSGEELISIARAKENIFFSYCLGFTSNRILALRVSRFRLRKKGFEAIPLSEIKAIRYAWLGQEGKDVLIEIPFEDSFVRITLVFREGAMFREDKRRTFTLMGINGSRKIRYQ